MLGLAMAAAAAATLPPLAVKAPTVRNQVEYEAASVGRRLRGWQAPTTGANAGLLGNLATLRDRSRASTRNDGYAKGALEKLVSNLVGTGIKPRSRAKDPEFRRYIQDRWLQWTDESDADGLLDFYGQQSQATYGWLEGGEAFIRRRPRLLSDGLSVPLQLQVIEPELCPLTYNTVLPNGNRVRAGIEHNGIGQRVAYHFHPSRPGDLLDYDQGQLRRVSADSVVHLFNPLRPGQLRGLPRLTHAMVNLFDLGKYRDAQLYRQQLANMFVGFVTSQPSIDSDPTNPLTGLPNTSTDTPPTIGFEPGTFNLLEPGEEVKFSDPPKVGQEYEVFMRQELSAVAAAIDLPYELLTGDMSRVNDRTVRVLLNEFRRRMQMLQHQVLAFQFCRTVWSWWLDAGFISGTLDLPADYVDTPERYAACQWTPQRWAYINPVQDVEADQKAIAAGFRSRSSVVSEYGDDAEQIDQEQADDNARADGMGLVYTSDGRNATKNSTAAAPPAPESDEYTKPGTENAA